MSVDNQVLQTARQCDRLIAKIVELAGDKHSGRRTQVPFRQVGSQAGRATLEFSKRWRRVHAHEVNQTIRITWAEGCLDNSPLLP
jgi:hypothetical protein